MLKSLFNKVAGLQACNFIKKSLQHRCFPVNIKNTYFEEHQRWLFVNQSSSANLLITQAYNALFPYNGQTHVENLVSSATRIFQLCMIILSALSVIVFAIVLIISFCS